ncbi:MAG: ABC transporter ATP-binding protein [Kofleriaceae bacterium]
MAGTDDKAPGKEPASAATATEAAAAKPPASEPVDPAAAEAALAAFERELAGGDAAGADAATAAAKAVPADVAVPADKAVPSAAAKVTAVAPKPAPAALPPVVTFRNVTKRYGDFTAIKDVTFQIADRPGKGEFVPILGPSGCGKSTIIRLIAGLAPQFPATSGEVIVGGRPVLGPGADRGMVFQDYTSFDNRTVLDNIAFGLECQGVSRAERHDRARYWIAKVGLSVARDEGKYPHELSGGMRQRVAIARTLILEPKIILMDEPFGALDPPTRSRMQDNLVELWREQSPTIFFITHSIEEAVFLGDHILVFSNSPGTILEERHVPPADRPSIEMHRDPTFQATVHELRDTIERLEASNRAGD